MVAEAKSRRDRLKNCIEAASRRDSCLEDYISDTGIIVAWTTDRRGAIIIRNVAY